MNTNNLTKTAVLALTMGLAMAARPAPAHASGSDYYDDDEDGDCYRDSYGRCTNGSSSGSPGGGAGCMRDSSGNFWGDCSGGYDPNSTFTTQVNAVAPPTLSDTVINIILNWTGNAGNIVSTYVAVLNYLGGSEANAANYQQVCTGAFQPPACYGQP